MRGKEKENAEDRRDRTGDCQKRWEEGEEGQKGEGTKNCEGKGGNALEKRFKV